MASWDHAPARHRDSSLVVVHPYFQGKPLADGKPLYQHQRVNPTILRVESV